MDFLYEKNPLADVETADTRSLARAIDAATWSAFLQVPFAEWVLKATGRNAHVVDTFLWYHEMLSIISEVNHFARSIISSSIESLNGRLVTCDLNIGFIVGPLRDLPTVDLTPDILYLLDIRFQRTYHRQWDYNEMAEFRTDTSLFRGIHHTLPGLLASSMTENDLRSFRDDYALMFMEDKGIHRWLDALGHSWNRRCEDVADGLQTDLKHGAAPSSLEYKKDLRGVMCTIEELFVFRSYIADTSKEELPENELGYQLELKFTWASPHDSVRSRVRKAPRHHARNHIVMETKVETASGVTLDLHQEGDKVLEAFNSDGYVIFKGAADTYSMEEAIENRPVRHFLAATGSDFKCIMCQHIVNSVIEKSAIDRSPQWERLSKKPEVIAVTCFHLLGDDSSCWEWEYDTSGRGKALGRTKVVSARGSCAMVG
ncbi:predicted protein [Histoplasma mississippiense (nom. inval.)]|uniref:predicted protein n=1 Tax=Ajellomyces capsulatus (strain NAm1 / WU24) TaxID=2059318 RepID=UPI000157D318|nr:predicted protein [Histoplasma mississippiense (nom. inval.)]EDN04908.1 predicted protein [Histoplasma mississippiense (nom. inval.)]